jgi:S1-C subfamily serine protease
VIRIDNVNDIAILKLADGTYPALPIVSSLKVRLGQSVSTIGFPETDLQGFSPKVTKGEISSLNGFRDDPREWQISVPVQAGNLVGIVTSKLGLKAIEMTGDIPQNVNYAVKSSYALDILRPYLNGNAPEPRRGIQPHFEDMVAEVQPAVVLILVYGP